LGLCTQLAVGIWWTWSYGWN